MLKSQSVVLPLFDSLSSTFSPDSKQLVLGGAQGIRLLQTDDFIVQSDLNIARDGGHCIVFDPTCRVLAIGRYNEGTVQLWSITSAISVDSFKAHFSFGV
jgi:WD40 repeat protein